MSHLRHILVLFACFSLLAGNARNGVRVEFDHDYGYRYEVEAIYERYPGRFLGTFVGVQSAREEKDGATQSMAFAGLHYVLPLMVEADVRINDQEALRFGLPATCSSPTGSILHGNGTVTMNTG